MRKSKVVVAGCGRFGAMLADTLAMHGRSVTVIDKDPHSLDRLDNQFPGFTLIADASRLSVLDSVGLRDADTLVAATDKDSVNIVIAQIAKRIFGVRNVYARLADDEMEALLRPYDITAICPHQLCLGQFALQSDLQAEEVPS